MKRLAIPLVTLAAVVGLCGFCVWRADHICQEAAVLLQQAQVSARRGDMREAETLSGESYALWQAQEGFLGVTLRHTETDDVTVLYPQLLECCRQGDRAEFLRRDLELQAALRALGRMELPYYFNVL